MLLGGAGSGFSFCSAVSSVMHSNLEIRVTPRAHGGLDTEMRPRGVEGMWCLDDSGSHGNWQWRLVRIAGSLTAGIVS